MIRNSIHRLMTPARCMVAWLAVSALVSCMTRRVEAQTTSSYLAFEVTLSGNANTPQIRITNRSRDLAITNVVLSIGDFSKHFDGVNVVQAPAFGTASASVVPGSRGDFIVVTLTGFEPGEFFTLGTDIDTDPDQNLVLDYRTVLFNNGGLPNAVVQVAGGGMTGTLTLADSAAGQASYTFRLPPPSRGLRISSVTDPNGPLRVERVTLKVNDVSLGSFIGETNLTLVDGDVVEVTVPPLVYRTMGGQDTTDIDAAQERFVPIGLSVNQVPQTGDPTLYRFTLEKQTDVVVKWRHEYALVIRHDVSATRSLSLDELGQPWAGPLTTFAAGNPVPEAKKHWIERNTKLTAEVDGQVLDLNRPGLDVRYVPKGFVAFGPPNRLTSGSDDVEAVRTNGVPNAQVFSWDNDQKPTVGDLQVDQAPPQRQQVRAFTMYGPGEITYVWQLQFGVRINGDDPSRSGLPRVFQKVGNGFVAVNTTEGVFWFNPGTWLRVASLATDPVSNLALSGWLNGDGYYFSSAGTIDTQDGSLIEGGAAKRLDGSPAAAWVTQFADRQGRIHHGMEIPNLDRSARVLWRYGNQQLKVAVDLGQHVFQTELMAWATVFTQPPERVELVAVTGANKNVNATQATVWDEAGQRLYPVVPGVLKVTWRPSSGAANPVDVLITANYPRVAHYPHIADTPPVALDPDATDAFVFKELRYTENNASVDGQKRFASAQPGKSVLLFSELQRDGRGQPREFVRVRVVDTRRWNDGLAVGSAIIGQKIRDRSLGRVYDRAELGTGFVMFSGARYNANVYQAAKLEGLAAKDVYDMAALRSEARLRTVVRPENLPGPVIPVNLHPGASDNERVVVVWYDDPTENDELLWPHRAVVYFPVWPTTPAEGLGRIVIASQFGSESVAADGTDQPVAEAVGNFDAETTYNPSRLQDVIIYSQADPNRAGYNPNEEHAVMAPSLRFAAVSPRPPAAYALRNNDLNLYNRANTGFTEAGETADHYSSHPFVLVQYRDTADGEAKMRVYRVEREDRQIPGYQFADPSVLDGGPSVTQLARQPFVRMYAGEPVIPFYPLVEVVGASPCPETFGTNLRGQTVYWEDHKGTSWSVSGGDDAWFTHSAYYPMAPDFWWPPNEPGFLEEVVGNGITRLRARVPQAGDCVAFLPRRIDALRGLAPDTTVTPTATLTADTVPTRVLFKSDWPEVVPVLKAGETLTFAGGEYRADNPFQVTINDLDEVEQVATPGLPGVLAFASAEVVFDSLNPRTESSGWTDRWTARVAQVLDRRSVALAGGAFPLDLQPATGRSRVRQGKLVFADLPASLQNRVRYDPLLGRLEIWGRLNDKEIGDRTLTASPPAVYVLEPNILGVEEEAQLAALSTQSSWKTAVAELAILSRNPSLLDLDRTGIPAPSSSSYRGTLEDFWEDYYRSLGSLAAGAPVPPAIAISNATPAYLVGLAPTRLRDANDVPVTIEDPITDGLMRAVSDPRLPAPERALGPGLALLPNPGFLDPDAGLPEVSYVSVVENNDPSLGGSPITVHVIKVDRRQRYRGAIKTLLSDNVFDENIVLRHQGDFGANAGELAFEWWYRPDDGSLDVPPPDLIASGRPNPWKIFPDPSGNRGVGRYQVTLKGNPNAPEALLADTFWFVRYRHTNDVVEGTRWDVAQPDGAPRVNFDWAGAGNSSPLTDTDLDGLPDYKAQLAQGWIKRVLDAVNPYEARIRDFSGDNPSTRSSMIAQLGARYEGAVALNPDKNVIENVGLIELYETILERGRDLSIDLSRPVSTPAIANALQLASTRLTDFYTVLGNEAYADAQDPTIGFGSDGVGTEDAVDLGSAPPAVFAFQNQVSSLIEEELALLRGVDESFARPVYNRLFWNFTKGEGEAAYAMNYALADVNQDGFMNEADAMLLYPQGHGDAWGHYLTALRNQYDLLRERNFNWVSRSEFYNLQDIVLKVDFLDERKFAQTAAAKAKAGAEIVGLTYRAKYVEDPTAQWQGYTDSNPDRAWGVQEWARRAGQGAYFDWITANALLPSRHPNDELEGIQKVDRTSNADIAVISANLNAIQATFDQSNAGRNPLGIGRESVPFDISAAMIDDLIFGQTHFEQVYERATKAMENAVATWEYANEPRNRVRKVANNETSFRNDVYQEDLTYKNELIRIFGRPYEGTMGPGKIYPAGYDGPDVLLYMYVDVRQIDDSTVPGPASGFAAFGSDGTLTGGQLYDAFKLGQGSGAAPRANLSDMQNIGTAALQLYFPTNLQALFSPSFYPDGSGFVSAAARSGLYSVKYTDLVSPKVGLENLTQLLPITAAGYTYQAPKDWGARVAPGELQMLISQMIQQEAAIATSIGAWDALSGEIVRTLRVINATLDKSANVRLKNEIFSRLKVITLAVTQGIEGTLDVLSEAEDTVNYITLAVNEAIPDTTPTGGLAVSPGDVLGPADAAAYITGSAIQSGIGWSQVAAKLVKLAAEIGLSIAENELDLFEKREDDALAVKEMLKGLEDLVGDEPIKRIEIFKEIQTLRELSDRYRSLVGEGTRLLDERTAYNKRVAAATQLNRYQDITFRVSRNHALQNYRSAFDLAARYAYLAARAYDYETNFDPTHSAAPTGVYAEIVRARTLGLFDGDAQFGGGGLGESLAWLRAQYRQMKGQLGINNPQYETGKMSLRTENYRILPPGSTQPGDDPQFPEGGADSDELWRNLLQSAVVEDLWKVPEFRYYCNPFAAAPEVSAGGTAPPEPGIVLRFGTEIQAGRNFFGRPLSGGDSAYDPSVFATKIRSVGVWLSDYRSGDILADLPATPRVYLVPIGVDVLRIPGTANPDLIRYWNVIDERIPVPFPSTTASLDRSNWIPLLDSLNGRLGEPRRFSMFRAYHDGESEVNYDELVTDSRLIGRSVWNTQWMLIIPGRALNADAAAGLQRFIDQVSDIKLVFQTYGYSGD